MPRKNTLESIGTISRRDTRRDLHQEQLRSSTRLHAQNPAHFLLVRAKGMQLIYRKLLRFLVPKMHPILPLRRCSLPIRKSRHGKVQRLISAGFDARQLPVIDHIGHLEFQAPVRIEVQQYIHALLERV